MFLPSLLAIIGIIVSLTTPVSADCECGYLDPQTNVVWTDATITYFNETGLNDVVTLPDQSPGIYGRDPAGQTGEGQQSWAVVGGFINPYEDSFDATYRSAYSFNNTYVDDSSLGLAMQISPANQKTHIVNGSQIVTRRRDILYGSFRASIQPLENHYGLGGAFKFAVAYNQSETIDISIIVPNAESNTTMQWSYSASSQDSMPRKFNYSWLDVSRSLPVEQRMDWISDKRIQYRNSGNNASIEFAEYVKGKNATNLPSTPAPVSFHAWSNGEKSASQGPPVNEALITHILYTRFFFNSSLPQRHAQFEEQCQAAISTSGLSDRAICNTEDLSLRNSTAFDLAALNHVKPVETKFAAPVWAIACYTFFLGLMIIVIIHGVIVRRMTAAEKKKMTAAPATCEGPKADHEILQPEKENMDNIDPIVADLTSRGLGQASFEVARSSLPLPELGRHWETDDSDDSDDDFDDVEQITGGIEGESDTIFACNRTVLPTYSARKSTPLTSFPPPSRNRLSAFRFDTSSPRRHRSPSMAASPFFDPFPEYSQPPSSSGTPVVEAKAALSTDLSVSWHPNARAPAIVRWGKRHDGDEVGQLAQPRVSIATLNANRRPSVMFVRDSFTSMILKRLHDWIFVTGEGVKTSIGVARIDYLDGLRGLACLLVSVGHFIIMFYQGTTGIPNAVHYPTFELWFTRLFGPIVNNAPLILGIFFTLPARTVCQRYLTKGGLVTMADSTVRRIPRLALPVAGACLANYFLIDIDAYKWVQRLASHTWSTWAYFQNYQNALTFLNSFISLWWASPPYSPALLTGYATGVLWTIPLILQGMWTCMLTALIAHELKTAWKRFIFYALCISLSWYAATWDMFFMAGLVIADLDANLKYRELAKKGVPLVLIPKVRIQGVWLAWIAFLGAAAIQWHRVLQLPGQNLTVEEYNIHPDWMTAQPRGWVGDRFTYTQTQPLVWIWIMSIFILADLSPGFQMFFRLRLWSFLGKHSMAFFLCHGIIFWTWGAWLCITLLLAGLPYWAAVLIVFVTSYFWLTLLCICFTSTFEAWSISFSKAVWRKASDNLNRKV